MNLISIRDLATHELMRLTEGPITPPETGWRRAAPPLIGGTLAFLFEQPSLRTMSSFATAATRVGLAPVSITTAGNPFRDQIDFEDEIEQLALTSRCVVVRASRPLDPDHYRLCPAPIINAGDGDNEHPTQTLIDLTVMRHFGLAGRTVAILGNLRDHRTAHSLALALRHFDVRLKLVSPPGLVMDPAYPGANAEAFPAESFAERDAAVADADFVYLLPTMSLSSPERLFEAVYSLNLAEASRALKPGAKILHPFPRFGELAKDLDYTSFDAYHLQTSVAASVRERVLRHVLELEEEMAPAARNRLAAEAGPRAREASARTRVPSPRGRGLG